MSSLQKDPEVSHIQSYWIPSLRTVRLSKSFDTAFCFLLLLHQIPPAQALKINVLTLVKEANSRFSKCQQALVPSTGSGENPLWFCFLVMFTFFGDTPASSFIVMVFLPVTSASISSSYEDIRCQSGVYPNLRMTSS